MTQQFEDLSWHDNAIHGFRIAEGNDGCSGQLTFDIDYIVEWICPTEEEGAFKFIVSAADLIFFEVTDLVIHVDYASCSASLQPMIIHEIQRKILTYPNGYSSFFWKIELNSPSNSYISFQSPQMSQMLRGKPVRSAAQFLWPSQRSL